jgi:hypothetical protein
LAGKRGNKTRGRGKKRVKGNDNGRVIIRPIPRDTFYDLAPKGLIRPMAFLPWTIRA